MACLLVYFVLELEYREQTINCRSRGSKTARKLLLLFTDPPIIKCDAQIDDPPSRVFDPSIIMAAQNKFLKLGDSTMDLLNLRISVNGLSILESYIYVHCTLILLFPCLQV